MAIKRMGKAHASRFASIVSDVNVLRPHAKAKKHLSILPKKSGRNSFGRVTTRHQGGRQKRFMRVVDWKRDKKDMPAVVLSIEYDPNRTANVALIQYLDGETRYILAPEGLKKSDSVVSGDMAPLAVGNNLPLKLIPAGTMIHCLELNPGKGAKLVRGAGSAAMLSGFEHDWALVKLPSGEMRRFTSNCTATIGQLSNVDWKNTIIGKAGRARLMGIRPTVRGTAQNPHSHPHGGGEGRTGEGMHPKTPWGKPARGVHTRKRNKYSAKLIISRRTK
jgi:large subunit ribosomal protein L2